MRKTIVANLGNKFKKNGAKKIKYFAPFFLISNAYPGLARLASNLACLQIGFKPINYQRPFQRKISPSETAVLPIDMCSLQNRFPADYHYRIFVFMLVSMNNYCIETNNLTHKFSAGEIALNNVNLRVTEGTIYGFLGPNGAGKTTTLKLILGLLKKQHGEISVFGKPFEKNRVEILKKLGSLIESPSLYEHLTAVENLRILQKIYQCPKERIEQVLNLVGLAQTGNKKTGQFSLGMKQRLSIAIALLHSPQLLILDEPTNGLDPNGILEIRELLKKLANLEGITILISSHLLAEIEKLVTHIGIINLGNLLFQGTLAELVNKQKQSSFIVFGTSDNQKALQIFENYKVPAQAESGKISVPLLEKELIARINEQLVLSRIAVYEIQTVQNDLEKIFFDVISE